MDFKPKMEPGSLSSGDVGDDEKLINMSIPDLISELRIATRIKQFDQVEKVLVARDAQLKGELDKTREILDGERLDRMKIEEELKKCEAQCEKGKRAEEHYEKLLGAVKKNWLEDGDTTVDELRTKNRKLKGELEIWKKKYLELDERILRLEHDTQLLVMEGGNNEEDRGAQLGEGEGKKETNGIHFHGRESGNNNADSTTTHRNGDTCAGIGLYSSNPNMDGSAIGRMGLGSIIEIEDSDDDDVCISKGASVKKEETSQFVTDNGHPSSLVAAAQQKCVLSVGQDVIGRVKRKLGSRDSSSSSSFESSDVERIFRSCSGHKIDKRRNT